MTRSYGYTIIEILVVLVVMGLTFTLGFVGFRDFARKQALNTVAAEIKADITLAQEQALSGKKPSGCVGYLRGFSLSVYADTASYIIRAVCDNLIDVSQKSYADSGVSLSLSGPNPLIFKTLGQGTNIDSGSQAVIQITQQTTNNYQLVTIGSNGEIN